MSAKFDSKWSGRHVRLVGVRVAILLGSTLVVPICPRVARAEDKAVLSKARAQFQRAIELEHAGNYTTALEEFRDVGQVRMTPQVRFHIASCEEKLGRLVTAMGGYQLALEDADRVGADFKTEVAAAVARLQASIPKLVIERALGADAAEVQLDGVALGASSVGVPVPLDPGPHSVSAKAPGYLPFNQTVSIAENEAKTVSISLTLAPVIEAPAPRGAGAGASLDKPAPKLLPYVIGGAGIASLIGSGVFFGLRQSALGNLEAKCGPNRDACPASAAGEYSNLKLYNATAQIALGVGVASLGTAVTLWVLQRRAARVSGVGLLPSAPNAVAGISCVGSF